MEYSPLIFLGSILRFLSFSVTFSIQSFTVERISLGSCSTHLKDIIYQWFVWYRWLVCYQTQRYSTDQWAVSIYSTLHVDNGF
jgi:hypothetical protein